MAINPMGKVPAIVHRGTVVTEVAAICAYLADAFPAARLAPGLSEPSRGTYLRCLFFAAGCIEPALTDKAFPRAPGARPSALGYGTYDDVLNAMEKLLGVGSYVLGERFSAADVYLGAQIDWALMTKSLEPRPTFLRYVERLADRPGHRRFLDKTKLLEDNLKAAR